jgi:hypothetical protein
MKVWGRGVGVGVGLGVGVGVGEGEGEGVVGGGEGPGHPIKNRLRAAGMKTRIQERESFPMESLSGNQGDRSQDNTDSAENHHRNRRHRFLPGRIRPTEVNQQQKRNQQT